MKDSSLEQLMCIRCAQCFPVSALQYYCTCGGLLEVHYPDQTFALLSQATLHSRLASNNPLDISGVWRFRELLGSFTPKEIVSHPEGRTRVYFRAVVSQYAGIDEFYLKHEGENPTGSFKDRGMTCAISHAKRLGIKTVGCASTGNTSASLAAYAAHAGMKAVVFLPAQKVSAGKLAQAIAYGATCIAIEGDFDDAMNMVKSLADEGILYMANSINAFRLEGQKTIIWELLQDLNWRSPDWIVVPGGNLGNTSAFGKALREAKRCGWIQKIPRLAVVQSTGADPFFQSFCKGWNPLVPQKAETIATAIRIGNPVNFEKAKRAIDETFGVVTSVSDKDILEAKRIIDASGIGCEPASACSLAGARKLQRDGIIKKSDLVVGILTGNILKDPDIILDNQQTVTTIKASLDCVRKIID